MTKEIRSIAIKLHEIVSIYGFGSAFRSSRYNDIDLLVIFESYEPRPFAQYIKFLGAVRALTVRFGTTIDITALTAVEASAKPLRESDRLISLYERTRKTS
jgi:predicted nucleotidyltransferase